MTPETTTAVPNNQCPLCSGSGQVAGESRGTADGPQYATCPDCNGIGREVAVAEPQSPVADSSDDVREYLTQFIRSVQRLTMGSRNRKQFRHQVQIGDDGHGRLWFGYGYFPPDKVLWWPETVPGAPAPNPEELTVEEGIARFLKAHGLE